MNQTQKMLAGAAVAAALAIAGYYGLVSPQQSVSIQNQANQALGTAPAGQQTGVPQNQSPQAPVPGPGGQAPVNPVPTNSAPH